MLVLTRKSDQKIMIGDDVVIQVIEIRGDSVRLGITAPKETAINRPDQKSGPSSRR